MTWGVVVARSDGEIGYLERRFVNCVEHVCETWDGKQVLLVGVDGQDVRDLERRGARLAGTRDDARQLALALHA